MKRNNRKNRRDTGSVDFSKFSSFNQRSFNSAPRDMHKTKCADCGKECEVPFKPKEGRPVYCRNCYAKHKTPRY